MIEHVIVALIVICAFGFTVRKYLPASLRVKLIYALRRRGTTASKVAGWMDTSSGCSSGCDTCGSCETPADGKVQAQVQEHVIKVVRR